MPRERKYVQIYDIVREANWWVRTCYYCGSRDIEVIQDQFGMHQVWCRNCGSEGPHRSEAGEAVRKWNKVDDGVYIVELGIATYEGDLKVWYTYEVEILNGGTLSKRKLKEVAIKEWQDETGATGYAHVWINYHGYQEED